MSFLFLALLTFLLAQDGRAYTPALPSNVTVQGVATSSLHLQWYTNGSDWEDLTHQSAGLNPSNAPVQGLFVHFSENGAGDETTTTPWIALVSCDANSTNSSSEVDIFTIAKERGAKSALLYSLYSETCIITPGYQSSALDVFTTQTLDSSQRIEYEFGQFGPHSQAYYGYFNAAMLNDATEVFDKTATSGYLDAPGFLFATILSYDANDGGVSDEPERDANGTSSSSGDSGDSDSGDSQNTGIAMIVLYAITGCVSALFFAVIVSGAIRAIRYPERYGPRVADPTLGGGQSRARGLGRAILDTFPVVKFGHSDRHPTFPNRKDIELAATDTGSSAVVVPDSMELAQRSFTAAHDEQHETVTSSTGEKAREDDRPLEGTSRVEQPPQTNTMEGGASRIPTSSREMDSGMPECIGRETCPICIVDFEEGDDLRVLPCEGKHRFHQSCVDPWLLELSGSCPICRQDFHALETIISGESGNETSPDNRHSVAGTSTTQNRFSRYLRFARRRQRPLSSMDSESPPSPVS